MWILWAGVLLCSASYTMSVPFLPLFLFDLGVQAEAVNLWAGIVHASAFMVGAFMAPLWGAVADKYGRKKMVIRAGLSLAIIYALIAFVRNPWELIVVRMLHGLVGGFVPASMAIVASVAPENKMGASLGIMQAGTMTGGILGPLFGSLLATWFGQRMSFLVAGGVIFVASLAVIFWVKEGKPAAARSKMKMREQFRTALHHRPLLSMLLLLLTFQLAFNMIQPLLTLHIANMKGNVQDAVLSSGLVFALIGAAGIIASPLWGRTGERRGYRPTLVICLVCAGIMLGIQFFIDQLWLFVAVQFVFGLFMAGVVPIVNTLVLRSMGKDFQGRSLGLTASANQLGGLVGPLAGGLLGYFMDIHWIFLTAGLILIVQGYAVYSSWKKRAADEDEPLSAS
ncbi:MFS transporter [Xylanibacillus composti]|nr:MFS transporter [Xylanibacillus composti]MDT9726776.1 MFS transporter [Xylanibacillus composti]